VRLCGGAIAACAVRFGPKASATWSFALGASRVGRLKKSLAALGEAAISLGESEGERRQLAIDALSGVRVEAKVA
jgi:hypothetical protein